MNKTNYNTRHDQWVRENTVRIRARLNFKTDADLVTIMEHTDNKQGMIKDALRYYIANGCPQVDILTESQVNFAIKQMLANKLTSQ